MAFPVKCKECEKALYGPVKYCPYCGIVLDAGASMEPIAAPPLVPEKAVAPTLQNAEQVIAASAKLPDESKSIKSVLGNIEEVQEKEPDEQDRIQEKNNVLPPLGERVIGQDGDSGYAGKEEIADKDIIIDEPIKLPWKWMAIFSILFLVCVIAYFGLRNKSDLSIDQSISQPLPVQTEASNIKKGTTRPGPFISSPLAEPPARNDAKRETARVLALEALRQGTDDHSISQSLPVQTEASNIKKGTARPEPFISPPLAEPPARNDAKRETARVLALEALRQGTDLSVSISKLPKLEKVLQAAKDLQEISPRYQDQVTAAKDTLDTASKARDKSLMAYLSKAIELGRYTPEQVSYAMGIIKNGDPTPREKIVLELLSGHIKTLSNSAKPDSAKMLSSFTQRFSNFVD